MSRGPSGLRRAPPPLLGCRWAWLGAPPTASGGGSRAPPAMPIDSLRAAEAPGSGQKESRIRIDIIIMVAIGVGLAKHRDLVCFGIFDFWRSGEVCWIAVRSVILLIGRPFSVLPKTAFQLRLHLTNVVTPRTPGFWRCLNVVATLLCVDSCLRSVAITPQKASYLLKNTPVFPLKQHSVIIHICFG